MKTPVLTKHARERCAEMGISTKVAKHIIRRPSLTHCAREGRTVASSDEYPGYLAVYVAGEPPIVVTVLFDTPERFRRNGETYELDPA